MMRSLFSAVSGLQSEQTAMDVIGNNIANVNTTGFKASRTLFEDIFSQTISNATAPTTTSGGSDAKQVGLGTSISTIGMNMTDGNTQNTAYALDFAITGDGLFVVQNSDGSYSYTRNGAFKTDSDGNLVTADGNYVMAVSRTATQKISNSDPVVDTSKTPPAPLFSKIQIKGTGDVYVDDGKGTITKVTGASISNYAIDKNGVITANVSFTDPTSHVTTDYGVQNIGRLVLSTFANEGGLEKQGSSNYGVSSDSGDANYNFVNNNCGKITSGSLEMSNVDLSTELTNMIVAQRGFQANSRVITTSDSMLEELINLKRS